jgi:hypothetical protein
VERKRNFACAALVPKKGRVVRIHLQSGSGFGILLFAFFLIFASFLTLQAQVKNSVNNDTADQSNFVQIEGSTNVNKFSFIQHLKDDSNNKIRIDDMGRIKLEIPASNFIASNPLMYDDFIDLIHAKAHPTITITIHHHPMEFVQSSSGHFSTKIDVKLAGRERRYILPGTLYIVEEETIRILGSIELNLNDFHLDPPTKFFGMVKVNQEVFVNFGLTMENQLLTKNQ